MLPALDKAHGSLKLGYDQLINVVVVSDEDIQLIASALDC